MKYLKFYEAFKSKGISNTLKFLREKVGKKTSDDFISSLKDFMNGVDFPIDQLSDSNIKYLSAKKAIQLRCESPVYNEKDIWVIKYWFSIEKGFLGYTATGNKEEKEIESSDNNNNGLRDTVSFTDRDIQYIKDRITPTGEIWKVLDYKKLQTGDTVIGEFDSSIGIAKIFVDINDRRRTYVIQSVASGSTIDNNDFRNYTQYGDRTWWIYDSSEMGSDHRKLHYWRPSSDELHYIEQPKEEEEKTEEEKTENPLVWNLPLTSRFTFSRWGRGSSIGSTNDIENADFSLVFYFDELINTKINGNNFEIPSETKKQRKSEKEGATKLMSDVQIKKMNIERYIQKITANLNISDTEFSELNKIVNKHLAQEFSYLSIYINKPDWSDLSDFCDYLYQVIDGRDKEYYIDRVKELYKRRTENYYNHLLRYQEVKTIIIGNTELKKTFDELYKLGNTIYQYFNKMEIKSIDDLWLVKRKISSLYEYMRMDRNQLDYKAREVVNSIRYISDVEHYYLQYKDSYSKQDHNIDVQKIKRIENFLKSL